MIFEHTEQGDEVKISHILFPVKMSLSTRDSVYGLVRNFFGDLRDRTGTFEESANRYGLPVLMTTPFNKDAFIPELGPVSREASDFAFSQEIDAVSQSITRQGKIFVLRKAASNPERQQTLDEVRDEIESILSMENRMNELQKRVELFVWGSEGCGEAWKRQQQGQDRTISSHPSSHDRIICRRSVNSMRLSGYAYTIPDDEIGGPVKTENGLLRDGGVEAEGDRHGVISEPPERISRPK